MSPGKSIQISLPEGWEDITVYTYKGPDDSGVQHNLIIMIDTELETNDLYRYAQQRVQVLKDSLQGFELLSEKEKKLKSGLEAFELVYKWAPAEGKIIFQKQVYIMSGDKAFNLTSSFSKQSLKTIGNDVDAMIDSFKAE